MSQLTGSLCDYLNKELALMENILAEDGDTTSKGSETPVSTQISITLVPESPTASAEQPLAESPDMFAEFVEEENEQHRENVEVALAFLGLKDVLDIFVDPTPPDSDVPAEDIVNEEVPVEDPSTDSLASLQRRGLLSYEILAENYEIDADSSCNDDSNQRQSSDFEIEETPVHQENRPESEPLSETVLQISARTVNRSTWNNGSIFRYNPNPANYIIEAVTSPEYESKEDGCEALERNTTTVIPNPVPVWLNTNSPPSQRQASLEMFDSSDVSHSEMERLCVTNSVVSEWSDSDNEPLANKLNQPQPTVTDVVEILPPPEPHVNDSGSIAVLRSSCNDDSNQRQSSDKTRQPQKRSSLDEPATLAAAKRKKYHEDVPVIPVFGTVDDTNHTAANVNATNIHTSLPDESARALRLRNRKREVDVEVDMPCRPKSIRGTRKVPVGEPPSAGRSTLTSMRGSGFIHKGILSLFMIARREGLYTDDGFARNLDKTVVQLELEMWEKCRNSLPKIATIHVDPSIWGTRSNSKAQIKGVQRSPTQFRKTADKVLQTMQLAIFLIVGRVKSTDRRRVLAHTNVLVVRKETDAKKSFVVFDPLMPSENETEYLPVTSTVDFVKEAMTLRDDQVLHVVFGKQNKSSDCFHRALDFVGRLIEGDVNLDETPTMQYPISTADVWARPTTVPACFYGGI